MPFSPQGLCTCCTFCLNGSMLHLPRWLAALPQRTLVPLAPTSISVQAQRACHESFLILQSGVEILSPTLHTFHCTSSCPVPFSVTVCDRHREKQGQGKTQAGYLYNVCFCQETVSSRRTGKLIALLSTTPDPKHTAWHTVSDHSGFAE